MYREFNALGTLEILKFLPSTRANCFHLRLRGVWHRQTLTCCPTKDLCASEVIITTPFISLQIRSELFSLIECEQVVLPINPARVGCQLVFALRLGTTIALGGADHRVWQRRIPETAHDESGIPLTLFTRQFRDIIKTKLVLTCTQMIDWGDFEYQRQKLWSVFGLLFWSRAHETFQKWDKMQITHLRCFSIRQKFLHVLSSSREHWHRGPPPLLLVAMEPTTARFVLGALPSP